MVKKAVSIMPDEADITKRKTSRRLTRLRPNQGGPKHHLFLEPGKLAAAV